MKGFCRFAKMQACSFNQYISIKENHKEDFIMSKVKMMSPAVPNMPWQDRADGKDRKSVV